MAGDNAGGFHFSILLKQGKGDALTVSSRRWGRDRREGRADTRADGPRCRPWRTSNGRGAVRDREGRNRYMRRRWGATPAGSAMPPCWRGSPPVGRAAAWFRPALAGRLRGVMVQPPARQAAMMATGVISFPPMALLMPDVRSGIGGAFVFFLRVCD